MFLNESTLLENNYLMIRDTAKEIKISQGQKTTYFQKLNSRDNNSQWDL